jgi:AraC-like DNA-binding protein
MPSPAPVAPTLFTTAGLPPARRVEPWEGHNRSALIALDVHAARPLDASSPIASRETGTVETMADVAARCGFTSATYFSRAFCFHFGIRASDVRRGYPQAPEIHDMT